MKRTSRLMIAAGLVLCLSSLPVLAQTEDAPAKAPQADKNAPAADKAPADAAAPVGDVNTELAALKQEVQGMRSDMKVLLRELQALKMAQAQAVKPAPQQQPRPAMDLLGKPAPEASFKTVSTNQEMKIGGKSDKVQVAIFFASWCGYCKRALPTLDQLKKDYAGKDVEIFAISLDTKEGQRAKTEPELIAEFEKLGMTVVPMSWDPDKKIGNQYKVQSFPTSFVIGKTGIVEAVHIGGPADLSKQIQGEVDKLLAGESLAKPAAVTPPGTAPAAAPGAAPTAPGAQG